MLIVAVLVCVVFLLIAVAVLALAVEISGWKGAVVVSAMYVLLAYGVGHSTANADIFATDHDPSPDVAALAAQATDFWAARGVTGCDTIRVRQILAIRIEDGVVASGAARPCKVWIADPLLVFTDHDHITIDSARTLCSTVFHEVGHALGLWHTPTGVMAVAPGIVPLAWVPWECRVWARDRIDTMFSD